MGDQNKRVRVYGLTTCPSCKRVKKYLEEQGVQFEYIEVDALDSGEQWLKTKELKQYNPQGTYPTVIVEDVILGLDEAGLKKALNLS